jgi:hypothetical protein
MVANKINNVESSSSLQFETLRDTFLVMIWASSVFSGPRFELNCKGVVEQPPLPN